MTFTDALKQINDSVPIFVHKVVVTDIENDVLQQYSEDQKQAIARPQCADIFITGNISLELGISDFRNLLLSERSNFASIGVVWNKAKDCSVLPSAIPLECVREAAKTTQSIRLTELGEQLLWALELYDKKRTDIICDMEVEPMLKNAITSALAALAVW